MKYKLINKQTGVETLCDKVTIDGFDYYVSDELPKLNDVVITSVGNIHYIKDDSKDFIEHVSGITKVLIATNNPNIDIPKVVDEVEKLAHEYFAEERDNWGKNNPNGLQSPQSLIEHYNKTFTPLYKAGYNKSQETHPFSEEDMIEFAEWVDNMGYRQVANGLYKSINDEKGKLTKELLQLWKEQKPKTVYCS